MGFIKNFKNYNFIQTFNKIKKHLINIHYSITRMQLTYYLHLTTLAINSRPPYSTIHNRTPISSIIPLNFSNSPQSNSSSKVIYDKVA